MKETKAIGIVVLIQACIVIACMVGEIMCIYKAVTCDFEPPYKAEIIYGASALTGIGAVVGYINISDSVAVEKR